jgi:hypothetical protein
MTRNEPENAAMTTVVARTLAGIIAALLLILCIEWLPSGEPPLPAITPPKLAAGSHAGQRAATRDTDTWVTAILSRPLFSIGRRPPKIAAPRSAGTQEGIPRLSGIMIATGFKRAIFAPEGGGKPLVLREGEPLADTAIRDIQPGQVILASGEVLHPAYDKNRVPGSQPYVAPGLPTPGVMNPSFAPGFQPPGFQSPNFQPPNFQPPNFQQPANADGTEPPPSPPPFRGVMMPQRRE